MGFEMKEFKQRVEIENEKFTHEQIVTDEYDAENVFNMLENLRPQIAMMEEYMGNHDEVNAESVKEYEKSLIKQSTDIMNTADEELIVAMVEKFKKEAAKTIAKRKKDFSSKTFLAEQVKNYALHLKDEYEKHMKKCAMYKKRVEAFETPFNNWSLKNVRKVQMFENNRAAEIKRQKEKQQALNTQKEIKE